MKPSKFQIHFANDCACLDKFKYAEPNGDFYSPI